MCAVVKTLFALPIIGLVSIPLLFSAWVTLSFALFTLFIRLTVVYVELGYALLANIFALPTSSSSLLTFAPSEPPTPITGLSRRNSSYGLIQSRRTDDSVSSLVISAAHGELASRNKELYARSMAEAHNLPSTPFMGLPISGDERRDFEGVGGWRSYFDSSRWHRPPAGNDKPLSSASSSSAASINGETDLDADERAWLSLNQRLELPSQVITLGSNTTSKVNSPTSPRLGSYFHALGPATSSRWHQPQQRPGPRHHQRSHTTSSLPTTGWRVGAGAGLSLALSTRPDQTFTHPVSPSASRLAPFMTPQPYSHTQARQPMRTLPASSASHQNGLFFTSTDDPDSGALGGSNGGNFGNGSSGGGGGGGGYFALQRPGSYYIPPRSGVSSPSRSGYTTPGTGTSNEERDTASQLARLMPHYPTSVRHRRRSVSGAALGERG